MPTGPNGIPTRMIDQLMKGLTDGHDGPVLLQLVREVGRVIDVPDHNGTYPLESTVSTLAGGLGDDIDHGTRPGAPVTETEADLDEVPYALRQFAHSARVSKSKQIQWASSTGEDLVRNRLAFCQQVSDLKTDLHMEDQLKSTSLNTAVDVTTADYNGAWNTPAAEPLTDAQRIARVIVPGADTLVIGGGLLDSMSNNAQFTSRVQNFSGGTVDENVVKEAFKQTVRSLKNVFIIDRFYNASQEGEAVEYGHVFNNMAWMGYGRDLVLFSCSVDNPESPQEEHKVDGYDRVAYKQYHQLQRPSQKLGAFLQNVHS